QHGRAARTDRQGAVVARDGDPGLGCGGWPSVHPVPPGGDGAGAGASGPGAAGAAAGAGAGAGAPASGVSSTGSPRSVWSSPPTGVSSRPASGSAAGTGAGVVPG